MIFELVKLTGGLLMPLPVILILLVIGLVLLTASRRRRLAATFIAAATVLLMAVSLPWLSAAALMDLEQDYPVLRKPPQAEWIVVLGGGSRHNKSVPCASRLGESSLYRLAEGVRLANLLPGARLVTTGSGFEGRDVSTAELMEKVAVDWGIDPSRIKTLTNPRNTEAEAREAAGLIDDDEDRVILVTSAFHMRRAMALFRGQGLEVIPAPAGHRVDRQRGGRHIGYKLPKSKYIGFAEAALWEHLGLLWAWLRGAR